MRSIGPQSIFALLLFPIWAVSASGCVSDDSASLYISHNVVPDENCTVEPDNVIRLGGYFNVEKQQTGYRLFPVYNSNLRNRGSASQADPNIIQITRARIRLMDESLTLLALNGVASEYDLVTTGFIPSTQSSAAAQQAVGSITAIPQNYGPALTDYLGGDTLRTIVVGVTVFGETIGDLDLESEEWTWPLQICSGDCLQVCIDPDAMEMQTTCTPYQDENTPVNCNGG